MSEILACYIRVSTEKQAKKGSSPATQREFSAKYAELLGMSCDFFDDSGNSAAKNSFANLPEYRRLLKGIESGKIKNVYAYDTSRLTRSDELTRTIQDACEKHKAILHTQNAKYDFSNPDSKLMFQITAAMATHQARMTQIKSKQGVERALRSGKAQGWGVAFGYTRNKEGKVVIDPYEAGVVKEIFTWKGMGYSDQKICDTLNERGEKCKHKGKIWKDQTIRHILKNTIYVAQRQSKQYTFEPNPDLRIISDALFNKVDETYGKNKPYTFEPTKHEQFLRGLVYCECGRSMYPVIKPNRSHFVYLCLSKRKGYESCGKRSPNLFKINDLIWNTIRQHLSDLSIRKAKLQEIFLTENPEHEKTLFNSSQYLKKVNDEIITIQEQLNRLPWLFTKGKIGEKEYESMEHELNKELQTLSNKRTALTQSEQVDMLANRIAQIHEELADILKAIKHTDMTTKAALCKSLIDKIIVHWDGKEHTIEIKFKIDTQTKWDALIHHQNGYISKYHPLNSNDRPYNGLLGGVIYTYKSIDFQPAEMVDIQLF